MASWEQPHFRWPKGTRGGRAIPEEGGSTSLGGGVTYQYPEGQRAHARLGWGLRRGLSGCPSKPNHNRTGWPGCLRLTHGDSDLGWPLAHFEQRQKDPTHLHWVQTAEISGHAETRHDGRVRERAESRRLEPMAEPLPPLPPKGLEMAPRRGPWCPSTPDGK